MRDFLALCAFTQTLFGYVLDEHQAQALCAVRGNLPLGLAGLAVDLHLQRRMPALAGPQMRAQLGENRFLAGGDTLRQGSRRADGSH